MLNIRLIVKDLSILYALFFITIEKLVIYAIHLNVVVELMMVGSIIY